MQTGRFFIALAMLAVPSAAVQIHFTGGTVTLLDGTTETTDNSVVWENVDYYEESGFRLDFIGNADPFSAIVGDYYGESDDVIHGHWAAGGFGDLNQIRVTKIDGTPFDLNYFILTSNTDVGGSSASGNEQARIHASPEGTTSSHSQLLQPAGWGFPATPIYLGTEFDDIRAFWFTAENFIDCFGMDSFFIDEPAPAAVPEPASLSLVGIGLATIAWRRFAKQSGRAKRPR